MRQGGCRAACAAGGVAHPRPIRCAANRGFAAFGQMPSGRSPTARAGWDADRGPPASDSGRSTDELLLSDKRRSSGMLGGAAGRGVAGNEASPQLTRGAPDHKNADFGRMRVLWEGGHGEWDGPEI